MKVTAAMRAAGTDTSIAPAKTADLTIHLSELFQRSPLNSWTASIMAITFSTGVFAWTLWIALKMNPVPRRENFTPVKDLPSDFLRRPERESFLSIDTSTPEYDSVVVIAFESPGVHIRGGELNGIDNVEPRIDKLFHEIGDGPAGMLEDLPLGISMDPIGHLHIVGLIEVPVCFDRAESGILGPEVSTAQEHRLGNLADNLMNLREVSCCGLRLPLKYPVEMILPGDSRDIPFGDIPDSLRRFQERPRDQGDVA
jgi:hypothetical protein